MRWQFNVGSVYQCGNENVMTSNIHSTAIVEEGAQIDFDVLIGPYCVISSGTKIKKGSKLHSHVITYGSVVMGESNELFPFCSIGAQPQDISYQDEETKVEIGDNNIFREYVSIHRGTIKENGVTKIGDGNFFMNYAHLGHDSVVGDNCIIVNSCDIGGHVKIGDGAILGGSTSVIQFRCIGAGAYVGAGSIIDKDVPAFFAGYGNRFLISGINIVGLKKKGYQRDEIKKVLEFYNSLQEGRTTLKDLLKKLEDRFSESDLIQKMIKEIKGSKNGIAGFKS